MTKPTDTQIRLPAAAAADTVLAEVLETGGSPAWSDEERDRATVDARRLTGPEVPAAAFLPVRARLVAARLREDAPKPADIKRVSYPTGAFALVIILGAYLLGAFTDRFTTDGARINLLSAPVLLLILWNLAVYVMLLLSALGLFKKGLGLPIRRSLTAAVAKAGIPALKKSAVKARFRARWTELMLPSLALTVSKILHFAAAAFAVGLLTSMAVRGIGTAYTAGWESTWFGASPETVKKVFDVLYGWVPGLGAIPDAAGVAAMRFDAGGAADSAPWIARLMALIALTVIAPRIVLGLIASWRAKKARLTLTLDTGTPYYRAVLAKAEETGEVAALVVAAGGGAEASEPWASFASHLALAAKGARTARLSCDPWSQDIAQALAPLSEAGSVLLAIGIDPMATPEEEVHLAMLKKAAQWCAERRSPAPAVLLDTSEMAKRFGAESPSLSSRTSLWEAAASSCGCAAVAADLADPAGAKHAEEALEAYWRRQKAEAAAEQ